MNPSSPPPTSSHIVKQYDPLYPETKNNQHLSNDNNVHNTSQVWNTAQPFLINTSSNSYGKNNSAASMLLLSEVAEQQLSRQKEQYSSPTSRNGTNMVSIHASGNSSPPNNYMHPSQQSHASSQSNTLFTPQTLPNPHSIKSEIAPSSYSAIGHERSTMSTNGSPINSQLLQANRGYQINNFDIPSSNYKRAPEGKSFIQQPLTELKTTSQNNLSRNLISNHNINSTTDTKPNSCPNTYTMNTNTSGGNGEGRFFNNHSTTQDQFYSPLTKQPASSASSPPPSHHVNSYVHEQPPQQTTSFTPMRYSSPTSSVNYNNGYYDDRMHNGNSSSFNRSNSENINYQNSNHVDLHSSSYLKYPRHVSSPTSTTYQFSSHHVPPSHAASLQNQPPIYNDAQYYKQSEQSSPPHPSNFNNHQVGISSSNTSLGNETLSNNVKTSHSQPSGSSDGNSDSKQNNVTDKKHKKKGPKKREISRDDMKKYFHVSQTIAAKMLGVSVSTLKRRFYEEFNMKWPYVPSKTNTSKRKKGDEGEHHSDEHESSHEIVPSNNIDASYHSPTKKVKKTDVFDNVEHTQYSSNGIHAQYYDRTPSSNPPPPSSSIYTHANNHHFMDARPRYEDPHGPPNPNNNNNGNYRHGSIASLQHAEPYSPSSPVRTLSSHPPTSLLSYHNSQSISSKRSSPPPGYLVKSEDVYSSMNHTIVTESSTPYDPMLGGLPPISSFKMQSWK